MVLVPNLYSKEFCGNNEKSDFLDGKNDFSYSTTIICNVFGKELQRFPRWFFSFFESDFVRFKTSNWLNVEVT